MEQEARAGEWIWGLAEPRERESEGPRTSWLNSTHVDAAGKA
jgi:hypothetical protein